MPTPSRSYCVLFGMRDDVQNDLGVTGDEEIEAPVAVNAGLPDGRGVLVFLGAERGVAEVLHQQFHLFVECFLDGGGSLSVVLYSGKRQSALHRARCLAAGFFFGRAFLASPWRNVIIASWFSKGPYVSPLFTCSRDSARRALMMRRCSGEYSRSTLSFGVRTILPLSALASTKSPSAKPTWTRSRVGMVTWPLRCTLTMLLMGINFRKPEIRTS